MRLPKYWKDERSLAPATGPATAPLAPASATPAFPRHHWTCFVYYESAAHEISPVAGFDGAIGCRIVADLDESEPSGLAREPVAHHVHAIHGDTRLRKEIRYIGFGSRIGEIAYK
jgi:hypothetical protein